MVSHSNDYLNKEQNEIVKAPLDPILISAGPGSGKTRVLVHRLIKLIRKDNIPPENIFMFTFTTKAAAEIRQRAASILGEDMVRRISIGTFHATALRILRQPQVMKSTEKTENPFHSHTTTTTNTTVANRHSSLPPRPEERFPRSNTVVNDTERAFLLERAVGRVMHQYRNRTGNAAARAIQHGEMVAYAKHRGMTPATFLEEVVLPMKDHDQRRSYMEHHRVYTEYEQLKIESELWDFDDLVLRAVNLLTHNNNNNNNTNTIPRKDNNHSGAGTHPAIHQQGAVLVDEFQDTNAIQLRFITALSRSHRCITAVGDPNQSIYSFRCAEPRIFNRFASLFPDVRRYSLRSNFRSSPSVIRLSHAIVQYPSSSSSSSLSSSSNISNYAFDPSSLSNISHQRHNNGPLPSFSRLSHPSAEAAFVVREIQRIQQHPAAVINNIAVFARTHALLLPVHQACRAAGVACSPPDTPDLTDRAEVRDVLAFLRIAQDIRDVVALERVSRLCDVGGAVMDDAVDHIPEGRKAVLHCLRKSESLGAQRLCRTITNARKANQSQQNASKIITQIVKDAQIELTLKSKYPDHWQQKLKNIEILQSRLSDCTLNQVVKKLDGSQSSLSNEYNSDKKFKSKVVLTTLHGSKGLEFDAVFIIGCSDGSIPLSKAQIEEEINEELRLLYVGITRAKHLVYLTQPKFKDKNSPEKSKLNISPFLGHIILEHNSLINCNNLPNLKEIKIKSSKRKLNNSNPRKKKKRKFLINDDDSD